MTASSPSDDSRPLPRVYGARAPAPLGAPPLEGAVETEIVIVGGGYTGLSTALHLAERGISCVVLEGGEIAAGGSGRAFGQVVPYMKHGDAAVLSHYGQEAGGRVLDAVSQGPSYVFDLARRYGIACDSVEAGLLLAANSASGARRLAAAAASLTSRGIPAEILTGADAHRAIGSTYYSYVLREPRGGHLNPLAYARGLGIAAARVGAVIHENSPAVRLERCPTGWRVHSEGGSVAARAVLVAGGAYLTGPWPALRSTFVPMRAYQLVTEPLAEDAWRTVLPGGQSLTDTRRLYSGMRRLPDRRILLSADGPAFDAGGRAFRAKATRRLRRIFPQAGQVAWAEEWTGWVDMTGDHYPHVHEVAPGLWGVVGLSGRGIVLATLLGRDMAARLAGAPGEAVIPVTVPRPITVGRFAPPLVSALMTLYRLIDRVEAPLYLSSTRSRSRRGRNLPAGKDLR